MYSHFLKRVAFPIGDLLRGIPIGKRLRELSVSQWWSATEIEEYQNQKLRALIKHAYENVPYYNDLFNEHRIVPADIQTKTDLAKIPILTKDIIRREFPDRLVAKNILPNDRFSSKTAGSTGEPLFFYIDKNTRAYDRAAYYRFLQWASVDVGYKLAYLWAGPERISHRESVISKAKNFLSRRIIIDALWMDEKHLERFAAILVSADIKILYGYASCVYLIADYMMRKGIELDKPIAVVTTAEVLPAFQREVIERQFQSRVFEVYGCGETNSIAYECNAHEGLHTTDEHVIVETVSSNGEVSSGCIDDIVITNLDNYATPFIRYRNGDRSRILGNQCSCGRKLGLIEPIDGRSYDMIRGINGNTVYGGFFHKFILSHKLNWVLKYDIRQYQVVQESEKNIIVKLVARERPDGFELSKLFKIMEDHLGNMNIDIRFVDYIQPGDSGKKRFVISKLPN